jgi:hypothetical protein
MYRRLLRLGVLVLAMGLCSQAARAGDHSIWTALFGHQDPRLTGTGIAVGAGAGGAAYALSHKYGTPATSIASPGVAYGITSYGCAVVYPIVATIVVHRALTPREAYTGMANCVLPVIGGWIVNAMLPHDAWTDGLPARRHHWHHHHHHHHHHH